MVRLLAVLALLLALAPAARAASVPVTPPVPEHRADPALTTYVQRSGPFKIGPYATLKSSAEVQPPEVPGAIVGMDARLVDKDGNELPQYVTMLHHLVFTNGGPDDRRRDPMCPKRTTRERFFGVSEELRPMTLPPGYGYPTDPKDLWRASIMVMHHRSGTEEFFLEYRVTIDPRPVTPVKPYWLSVIPCSPDPQWTVPGRGSKEHRRSRTYAMPEAGRIVAVGGHLHGGANELILNQPACRHRTLVSNKPFYAPADDKLYAVKPLLHEPDPKAISWWQSPTGYAFRKGEELKVTAAYDNTRPHTRVMGISHVYVAPPLPNAPNVRCAPAPPDAQELGAEFERPRTAPPKVGLTLSRVGKDGLARPTTKADGKAREITGDSARVTVRDFAFSARNLVVGLGTTVRWRFPDDEQHDVTLARGPLGFGSPWLKDGGQYGRRFTEPGRYLLMCSLHSAYMSQVVTVRSTPSRPRRPDGDRPRR
jgi:plastocyanin